MTRFGTCSRRFLRCTLPLSLLCCSATSSWNEVRRVLAPAGRVDAVLAERSGGRRRFEYQIYVVPSGAAALTARPVATLSGAARNDSAYGAQLHWIGPDRLSIEYLRAEHALVLTPDVEIAGVRVRVLLSPGKRDPLAPAGGMLRGTRGRPR
jgi:hypothetical protein